MDWPRLCFASLKASIFRFAIFLQSNGKYGYPWESYASSCDFPIHVRFGYMTIRSDAANTWRCIYVKKLATYYISSTWIVGILGCYFTTILGWPPLHAQIRIYIYIYTVHIISYIQYVHINKNMYTVCKQMCVKDMFIYVYIYICVCVHASDTFDPQFSQEKLVVKPWPKTLGCWANFSSMFVRFPDIVTEEPGRKNVGQTAVAYLKI